MKKFTDPMNHEDQKLIEAIIHNARRIILKMLRTSQSGHPGGSLSSLDFLATLYTTRIYHTNEPVIVSNGHISPAVYSLLATLGVANEAEVIKGFRQYGSKFEGHVTRHVNGVWYGTGPLGIGISAAIGFALNQKKQKIREKSFFVIGDGEAQEGQVHEAALFAAKENLNNLIGFCDYNAVQLTDSLEKICPTPVGEIFRAHGWEIIDIDGHDIPIIHKAITKAEKSNKPVMIIGKTIMGYGIPEMQKDGEQHKSTWHGKAPKPADIDIMLAEMPEVDKEILKKFFAKNSSQIQTLPISMEEKFAKNSKIKAGTPKLYQTDTLTDCRSAYGEALLDLAKNNDNILAASADLRGSVMTKFVAEKIPEQHIEFGICEQNMVSTCGAISLGANIPFCSTFGAFMSSRAKDQARVNDINHTNVKMVATHCGLSVGEDGPTHQAIDDMGSFMGLFNTGVIEPADPNHCDRIIRYIASHFGNFYVRMGRHKLPVLTREDGSIIFDENYEYKYGKCEILREGSACTILASGSMISEALKAREKSNIDAEIIIASSPKQFDHTLRDSAKKTKKIIVVEDHNSLNGFGSMVALHLAQENIFLEKYIPLGVSEYQLSGKPEELYVSAGIGADAIITAMKKEKIFS